MQSLLSCYFFSILANLENQVIEEVDTSNFTDISLITSKISWILWLSLKTFRQKAFPWTPWFGGHSLPSFTYQQVLLPDCLIHIRQIPVPNLTWLSHTTISAHPRVHPTLILFRTFSQNSVVTPYRRPGQTTVCGPYLAISTTLFDPH